MRAKPVKIAAVTLLCGTLAHVSWADEPADPAETMPGGAVSTSAQLLKDADDIVFSAQALKPIALDNLPAPIDLNTAINPPGNEVSGIARTLGDLDPAEIPATARTLRGTARSNLPGAASPRSAGGAHIPSLPPAAQNRGRGRGRGGR